MFTGALIAWMTFSFAITLASVAFAVLALAGLAGAALIFCLFASKSAQRDQQKCATEDEGIKQIHGISFHRGRHAPPSVLNGPGEAKRDQHSSEEPAAPWRGGWLAWDLKVQGHWTEQSQNLQFVEVLAIGLKRAPARPRRPVLISPGEHRAASPFPAVPQRWAARSESPTNAAPRALLSHSSQRATRPTAWPC
jgi:hypothetical protein